MQPDLLSRLQERVKNEGDEDLLKLIRAYERLDGIAAALARQLTACERQLELAKAANQLVCQQRDEAFAKLSETRVFQAA